MEMRMQIGEVVLYKPPGEKRGKILVPPGDAWADNPQDLERAADHSFAKALESVAQNHQDKRVLILDVTAADSAAWIVHTVPGYPKPKVAYTFPASEYANGHLLLCLTISESQIEPIAVALFVAAPFIHYNDVPDAEVSTRPTLKKLLNGETAIKPPFLTKQNIVTQGAPAIPVQVFSKSERSKYEIYQKIISKQLKKTIKVWSRRDKKLKANCKIPGRHILLVSSPIDVNTKASSLEKDVTNWLIPENGDIFCAVDKPYALHYLSQQSSNYRAILYKPPGQKRGSLLIPPGAAWEGYPADLDAGAGHSFWKTFESVVAAQNNKNFFAYNSVAPGVVGVRTKSNSKGVVILDTSAGADEAAWIVHTVPGYPTPRVAYTFPASEYANGHLLICLTISESQIEPIAAALSLASPFIYYNDVPDAELDSRPSLKKVLNGETAMKPPFSTKQNIKTQANPSVPVQIFSKSERSKYEIYQKIISKQLKKTIKVWSRRDKKLKANCKIPGRHILHVSTPIDVNTQASSLEKDVTNWLIPENGDIFCAVDKPYAISQKYEPAVAVCIKLANIFARFNTIAAKVDSCS
ncbi:Plancitoxin-1 [Trichinella sp. T8]|nr:Plancitoxin-1 [Trichinella sp. T8]